VEPVVVVSQAAAAAELAAAECAAVWVVALFQVVSAAELVAAGIQVFFHTRFASVVLAPAFDLADEAYSSERPMFFCFPNSGRFSSFASFD